MPSKDFDTSVLARTEIPTGITQMSRPDRSDAHLPPEEEAQRAEELREYFDGIAPKRHSKPSRSEHSSVYMDAFPPIYNNHTTPELDKLQQLEEHRQKLVCDSGKVPEEYVETEYYKDLNCVNKQHHATGTGFIKMEKPKGSSFKLYQDSNPAEHHASCKGNPATNEWIPSADAVLPVSDKPNRSDS